MSIEWINIHDRAPIRLKDYLLTVIDPYDGARIVYHCFWREDGWMMVSDGEPLGDFKPLSYAECPDPDQRTYEKRASMGAIDVQRLQDDFLKGLR